MILVGSATPLLPEDDRAIPAVLDPSCVAAVSQLLGGPRAFEGWTAELDDGLVVFRNGAGAFTGACSEEVYDKLRAAPVETTTPRILSMSDLFGLNDLATPRRRSSVLDLTRARESDADEVFATANGPVTAGE